MALTSTHKSDSLPENSMATIRERWLGNMFVTKDVENKGYISEKSSVRLICELNPRLTVSRVKQKVKVNFFGIIYFSIFKFTGSICTWSY